MKSNKRTFKQPAREEKDTNGAIIFRPRHVYPAQAACEGDGPVAKLAEAQQGPVGEAGEHKCQLEKVEALEPQKPEDFNFATV